MFCKIPTHVVPAHRTAFTFHRFPNDFPLLRRPPRAAFDVSSVLFLSFLLCFSYLSLPPFLSSPSLRFSQCLFRLPLSFLHSCSIWFFRFPVCFHHAIFKLPVLLSFFHFLHQGHPLFSPLPSLLLIVAVLPLFLNCFAPLLPLSSSSFLSNPLLLSRFPLSSFHLLSLVPLLNTTSSCLLFLFLCILSGRPSRAISGADRSSTNLCSLFLFVFLFFLLFFEIFGREGTFSAFDKRNIHDAH